MLPLTRTCGLNPTTGTPIAVATTAQRTSSSSLYADTPSNIACAGSAADFLRNNGVATYIDDRHAIAHNKIMVIDRATIITGSFNFTKAAEEKNAENILVIKGNPGLASKYLANFEWHLKHSVRYEGRNR